MIMKCVLKVDEKGPAKGLQRSTITQKMLSRIKRTLIGLYLSWADDRSTWLFDPKSLE